MSNKQINKRENEMYDIDGIILLKALLIVGLFTFLWLRSKRDNAKGIDVYKPDGMLDAFYWGDFRHGTNHFFKETSTGKIIEYKVASGLGVAGGEEAGRKFYTDACPTRKIKFLGYGIIHSVNGVKQGRFRQYK